jgi:hypothetical protein
MFPQPWYPTKAFPHPLANLSQESKWSVMNKISYKVFDKFMWVGMKAIINDFRRKVSMYVYMCIHVHVHMYVCIYECINDFRWKVGGIVTRVCQ